MHVPFKLISTPPKEETTYGRLDFLWEVKGSQRWTTANCHKAGNVNSWPDVLEDLCDNLNTCQSSRQMDKQQPTGAVELVGSLCHVANVWYTE